MIDLFWWYTTTLVFVGFIACFIAFYRYSIHNKYIEAEKRLRLKLNEATSYFKGDNEKVPDFLQNAIGDIGIEGIMNELGIDPTILKNPLVKGLVEKYAPRVLEQLQKGGKGDKSKGEEIPLL